jgi:protein involved in polysaccharide export with SLBB domain
MAALAGVQGDLGMKIQAPLLAAFALTWIVGCARHTPLGPFEGRPHGMYPGQADSAYVDYEIGLGDELEIIVQRHPEFDGKVTVEASGLVTVPTSLDRVKAAGLTLRGLEGKLVETLRPYLLSTPRVNVTLLNPNSRFVYVLGSVRSPGKYVMKDEHLDVREAVVRAGLPLEIAALKRTKLFSSSPDRSDVRTVNLKSILYKGQLRENYELKSGDIIYVPNIYVWDLSWWMIQFLRPFQVLASYDQTAGDLSRIPSWQQQGQQSGAVK